VIYAAIILVNKNCHIFHKLILLYIRFGQHNAALKISTKDDNDKCFRPKHRVIDSVCVCPKMTSNNLAFFPFLMTLLTETTECRDRVFLFPV